MRFIYSIIRFVPNPARGEFINVGAVVGSDDSGEWDMRMVANPKRARRIDDAGVVKAVWLVADDIGQRIDRTTDEDHLFGAEDRASESWLNQLWKESNNIVQFSQPAPIVARNAKEALDIVFAQLVLDPESTELPYRRKNSAVSAIRAAYVDLGIRREVNFLEHVTVQAQHHKEDFDFVVANGKVVQLAQAWSFQLPNQQDLAEAVKAWAWTVRDLRNAGGGSVVKGERRLSIPSDVDVAAVYIPPLTGGPTSALEEAAAAFADPEVRVRLVEMGDVVGAVSAPARDLLTASSVH